MKFQGRFYTIHYKAETTFFPSVGNSPGADQTNRLTLARRYKPIPSGTE